MPLANWRTQVYNVVQSLLFNNPHRVVHFMVRDAEGELYDRSKRPAPVRRLYETETPPERNCLQTIQFVHHVLIPPHGRHVAELHVHPDAEELIIVTRGNGTVFLEGEEIPLNPEDVVYVPPNAEHEFRNTSDELLGLIFINVPTGGGLTRLQQAQRSGAAVDGQ